MSNRPCTVEGCPEPRVVYPSGVRSMCLGHIRERQREASRRWSEAHPGRKMEVERRWREANPERRAEIVRRHREANPESMRAASRRWREAHPDRQREAERRWLEANRDRVRATRKRRGEAQRERLTEVSRRWRAAHPEAVLETARRRRERNAGLVGRYARIECILDLRCGLPIRQGDETEMGHEPPIAWLREHPEYDGPCVVAPQHRVCNHRDQTTPFWMLDWRGA